MSVYAESPISVRRAHSSRPTFVSHDIRSFALPQVGEKLPHIIIVQIFTGNVIYEVPFHMENRTVNALVAGWSLSGIAILQSGFPQTPSLSAPNTGLAARPNQVGALHFSGKRDQIFNPNAFAIPGYGFFGNASVGSIHGPSDIAFNTALYKTFAVSKQVNFQFRAEAFNVANHPNFQAVDTGIGPNDPTPGLVSSPADPRILELAGRFTF